MAQDKVKKKWNNYGCTRSRAYLKLNRRYIDCGKRHKILIMKAIATMLKNAMRKKCILKDS